MPTVTTQLQVFGQKKIFFWGGGRGETVTICSLKKNKLVSIIIAIVFENLSEAKVFRPGENWF